MTTHTEPRPAGAPSKHAPAPGLSEASPRDVRAWLDEGSAVLVDVREVDEHARERISEARLVPLSRFDVGRAAEGIKPGQRLVLHCRSGRRSADACERAAGLASAGVEVVNMSGASRRGRATVCRWKWTRAWPA